MNDLKTKASKYPLLLEGQGGGLVVQIQPQHQIPSLLPILPSKEIHVRSNDRMSFWRVMLDDHGDRRTPPLTKEHVEVRGVKAPKKSLKVGVLARKGTWPPSLEL